MMKTSICEKVNIGETSSDNQWKHICKYIRICAKKKKKKRLRRKKKRMTWISFVSLIMILKECVPNIFFFLIKIT